jgi:putative membrane protein
MRLLIRWILNTLALMLVANIMPGYEYRSWLWLAAAAALLGLLNAVVRPILYLLTLPLTILTLGLFLLVLNAVMLKLTAALLPGFEIHGFWWAFLGALFLSAIALIIDPLTRKNEKS